MKWAVTCTILTLAGDIANKAADLYVFIRKIEDHMMLEGMSFLWERCWRVLSIALYCCVLVLNPYPWYVVFGRYPWYVVVGRYRNTWLLEGIHDTWLLEGIRYRNTRLFEVIRYCVVWISIVSDQYHWYRYWLFGSIRNVCCEKSSLLLCN